MVGHLTDLLRRTTKGGQLVIRGTYKDGEKCGEWIEVDETVTYDPC